MDRSLSDEEIQRFIAEVCLDDKPDEERDLGGLLDRHGISALDASILRLAPHRLALYRRLVRGNLLGVVSKMMPRTRARLNDLGSGAFDRSFGRFLATAAPRTHYLRDVPAEFLAWALPSWRTDGAIPDYAADLATHELVEFQIAAATMRSESPALGELALDRAVLFIPLHRLVRYAYAVHALPPEESDRSDPVERSVALFVHRDADHRVRFLELTPLAARIVEKLLAHVPLGEAIAEACKAEGMALTESVLASTSRMLADWGERGILLGGEASLSA
jgi:hypothetical protein